jgi:hypothetical protein
MSWSFVEINDTVKSVRDVLDPDIYRLPPYPFVAHD